MKSIMIKIKNYLILLTINLSLLGCSINPEISLIKPIQNECITLDIPPAIPKKLYIERDDNNLKTDDNGEALLRSYAAIRKAIRKAWHE